MNKKTKIIWAAFWAWIGIAVVSGLIIAIEEAGIIHWQGRIPITWMAVADPRLFWAIEGAMLAAAAWWAVHWYRRKYGDIAKRLNKK